MAKTQDPEAAAKAAEKKKIKEEKKRLKQEQKQQRKEAKTKAKELSAQEAELVDEEDSGGIPVFLVTIFIIAVWMAILCVLIKLDVGGIGSGVLSPILKNIPVLNQILPEEKGPEEELSEEDEEYAEGYSSLKKAIEQIKNLEKELEQAQEQNLEYSDQISELRQEVSRLQNFEDDQLEFERIREEFYEEVVYAEKGPGPEAFQEYYQSMNPETAEYIYRQVVLETTEDAKIGEYASAYSSMKPKEAAAIFDTMTDDLGLVARILGAMGADDRGKILAQMNAENAARLTKIMEPEN